MSAVTVQDLELEHAELLAGREILRGGLSITPAGQFGLLDVGPILSGKTLVKSVPGNSIAIGNVGIGNF